MLTKVRVRLLLSGLAISMIWTGSASADHFQPVVIDKCVNGAATWNLDTLGVAVPINVGTGRLCQTIARSHVGDTSCGCHHTVLGVCTGWYGSGHFRVSWGNERFVGSKANMTSDASPEAQKYEYEAHSHNLVAGKSLCDSTLQAQMAAADSNSNIAAQSFKGVNGGADAFVDAAACALNVCPVSLPVSLCVRNGWMEWSGSLASASFTFRGSARDCATDLFVGRIEGAGGSLS